MGGSRALRQQRNNIATMPWERRRLVSRLAFDAQGIEAINAELQRQFPGSPKIHATTLIAWRQSAEYVRYRTAREEDREETETTQAMAAALNDGRGPENMADLTVMEVVKELWRQTRGGQITDLGDLANVTKALAPLLRAKIARDLADSRSREQELVAEIAKLKEAHAARISSMQAEIGKLQAALCGGKTVDLKQVAADMEKLLGGTGG